MKFMIIDTALPPDSNADPLKIVDILTDTKRVFSDWVKSGKMETWYHFADRAGGIGIINVESRNELDELLSGHPAAAITKTQVYPLVDPEHGLNNHIESLKNRGIDKSLRSGCSSSEVFI